MRIVLLIVFCLLFQSCGTDSTFQFDLSVPTQAMPHVQRIDPANGKAGDAITIFGFGFSVTAGNNIVTIGGVSITASAYATLATPVEGEIETITVTIPQGLTVGDNNIFVTTFDNTSNTDIAFNVTE